MPQIKLPKFPQKRRVPRGFDAAWSVHTHMMPEEARKAPHHEKEQEAVPTRSRLSGANRRVIMRARAAKTRPALSERLLRNTAVAAVLVLAVLTVGQLQYPWAQSMKASVGRVLTARIDLDETLGKLRFVRDLMPDAVLVFWDSGSAAQPVTGTITHPYDAAQPWLEYSAAEDSAVSAVREGTVQGTSKGAQGDWIVLLRHSDGTETVYAYLKSVMVERGQTVPKGAQIGTSGQTVYFEYRVDSQPANPGTLLGIR